MKLPAILTAALSALTIASAHADTLVDTWTLSGGGLDPANYTAEANKYLPSALVSDASSTGSATITGLDTFTGSSGFGTGGIGSSSGFPNGYGGIYTFFSSSITLTVQTSTVLSGVDTVTFSALIGGGSNATFVPSLNQSSLLLDFNADNTAVAASSYSVSVDPITVSTPIGDQDLHLYTWTWDVGSLGDSVAFAFDISTTNDPHVWLQDLSLTQATAAAVPEPATYAAIFGGLVLVGVVLRRRFGRKA